MNKFQELKKNYVPEQVTKLNENELSWFRNSKFGMFIHWGLYSILERGEWVMFNERLSVGEYSELAERFYADRFDARAWARTAKAAGMKYMVLTTRHHDGFCLFDSKVSKFNSVNSAAKRDIVKEYVEACREEGLKVGLYYSPMDWRFPGYFFPELYYENAMAMKEQCWSQLKELMTNYGKIDLLWFDGEWLAHGGIDSTNCKWGCKEGWQTNEYTRSNYFWESEKLVNLIRKLQPGIVINNRSGWEGDFHSREGRIGEIRSDKPWEACDTIGGSWGWSSGKTALSLDACIRMLVNIATRDGNFLLNIGPKPSGEMEAGQVKRLGEIGNWLKQCGESIYNTRGGPIAPQEWGGTTYKENKIYVHILNWNNSSIALPLKDNKLVTYKNITIGNVQVQQTWDAIVIINFERKEEIIDTIVELEFENEIIWDGIKAVENDIYGLADGQN